MTRTLDGDRIVWHLRQRGVPASVEQTGGGVATIYAGTPWHEDGWGGRYPAIAGPGWFEDVTDVVGRPARFASPRFTTAELYIGPDDDGDTGPDDWPDVLRVRPGDDEQRVAQRIAAAVRYYREARS